MSEAGERILTEWRKSRDRGEDVAQRRVIAAHPECADELRAGFAAQDLADLALFCPRRRAYGAGKMMTNLAPPEAGLSRGRGRPAPYGLRGPRPQADRMREAAGSKMRRQAAP